MMKADVQGQHPPSDSSPVEHSLRNACLEVRFAPQAGGRVLSLHHVEHGDILVPLGAASFDQAVRTKAGAFPLFPFHNRLRSASFRHEGREHHLRPNATNGTDAMHGPAHRRPWRVTLSEPDTVGMTLTYGADDDWPFDFEAAQHFVLRDNVLSIHLSLTNTGTFTMPGGIGWHPYFKPSPDGRVHIDAAWEWDLFGASRPVALDDHHTDTSIARDTTKHFTGWTTVTARIGRDATISMSGDVTLSCLAVLHKENYLCLEPVSHVAGALECPPDLKPATGLRLLSPGETLTGVTMLTIV